MTQAFQPASYDADVLVIGGGPAGAWAAASAAKAGASVALVDKGYLGTSGATAPSGTGVWYVPPDQQKRHAAIVSREALGGYLADREWSERVLDKTYQGINFLAEQGYPFPRDEAGEQQRVSLQGPEYMRLMRRIVQTAGVRIFDHSPALELLVDEAGQVAGATGLRRQEGGAWTVRAGAVVIATGGCAFLSRALGCNVLTGEGHLMAAEVGADLSGMEFSNAYALAPLSGSVTKGLFYSWATFTYADGGVIPGAASQGGRSAIARTLLERQPVYCVLDKADSATRLAMRDAQPNFFLPFDRAGIDPFTQRFQVTLRLEGTVRGTGGLRILDETCATSVPGLYAAGDAATRELICGGFTGGGSHNAAWAIASGQWAGTAAADRGKRTRRRKAAFRAGRVALAEKTARAFDPAEAIAAVQAEVFPYERNYFRTGDGLASSLERLDALWARIRRAGAAPAEQLVRAREAAGMVATARWMYRAALARKETRGMHKRLDLPGADSAQRHYLTVGGLDDVWVEARPAPRLSADIAA